mmetsp:Transcript_30735/g.72133  ORF Transcript_30735/g.72133 Transcript_30735/m.72133 type:complete len:203 (+) Transcript_30735:751-1359(+)
MLEPEDGTCVFVEEATAFNTNIRACSTIAVKRELQSNWTFTSFSADPVGVLIKSAANICEFSNAWRRGINLQHLYIPATVPGARSVTASLNLSFPSMTNFASNSRGRITSASLWCPLAESGRGNVLNFVVADSTLRLAPSTPNNLFRLLPSPVERECRSKRRVHAFIRESTNREKEPEILFTRAEGANGTVDFVHDVVFPKL